MIAKKIVKSVNTKKLDIKSAVPGTKVPGLKVIFLFTVIFIIRSDGENFFLFTFVMKLSIKLSISI